MSDPTQANGETTIEVDPMRAKHLHSNLNEVVQRITRVAGNDRKVRLVAVSKLQPASDISALHHADPTPHLHFGENYVQELMGKARILPRSIHWHMIGGLQTNKCRPLAEQVPNLYSVNSVDTIKKADELNKGRGKASSPSSSSEASSPSRLRVFVQVNTSGEDSKSGVEPDRNCEELCRHIQEQCPHLQLAGLMTIGAIARSQAATTENGENEDFVTLREVRDRVATALGIEKKEELELSMGMSADFEAAIKQGSDEVRVGTTIFGERPAKKDAVI